MFVGLYGICDASCGCSIVACDVGGEAVAKMFDFFFEEATPLHIFRAMYSINSPGQNQLPI
jgi:hypothetical protein